MADDIQQSTPAQVTEKGVQSIKDFLTCAKDLAIFGKEVMADGKVDMTDLVALEKLVLKYQDFVKAVGEISDVVPEAKDISLVEAQDLIATIVSGVAEVKAAA